MLFGYAMQTIPRQVWLDKSGKQLIQWPIEEVEKLRKNQVSISGKKLPSKSVLEVAGITASQVSQKIPHTLTYYFFP